MYGKQRNYMTAVLRKALNAPLISSKDLSLPVMANCIGCSLIYPLLPVCSSIPLSIRVAYLMICSPLEATILWSVGQGDHKTSAWPTTSALEPLWGRAKHTKTHTRQKNTLQRRMHICTHSIWSTRRWKNYVFPTGWSPLSAACSETLCVLLCKIYYRQSCPQPYWLDTKPEAWFKSTNLSKRNLLGPVRKSNLKDLSWKILEVWSGQAAPQALLGNSQLMGSYNCTSHRGPFHIHLRV